MSRANSVLRNVIVRVAHHPSFRRLATQTRPGMAVASRFVAGETLAEAMATARVLHEEGIAATLDHLGENVETSVQALTAREAYLRALGAIAETQDLGASIAVKLTQLGLDDSLDVCWANLAPILDAAARTGTRVTIDMESHQYVDATLTIASRACERYDHAGVAIQSYLVRTERDVFTLPPGCRVRIVKGAYLEPPDIVLPRKQDVDVAFARLFSTLLQRGHPIDVATHDPSLIEGVRERVDALEDGWSRVEFQMLYGVRRDLQAQLADQGYPVRVYIPYGTEWYPYLTRRLAERPANLWFFASNLLRTSR
ncbi:MAG: proline dehydrogenase family protein [Actinomycetota bacterium]